MNFSKLLVSTAVAALVASSAMADIKIGTSLPLTGAFSIAGAKHEQGY